MKKGVRLWISLAISFVAVLIVVTSSLFALILYQNNRYIRSNEEDYLLSIAKQLAIDPQVTSALEHDVAGSVNTSLETYSKKIQKIHDFDFVVIMNMRGIRLTHPDRKQIGEHFRGGDETVALNGKQHVSISKGTLGESLRGFVPVYSSTDDKQQIGVVALGVRVQTLGTLAKSSQQGYTLALLISIGIGLIAAYALTYYLKKQLHNLEPKEIARIFEERNAMLDETKDAVVVTDLTQQINLANITAKTLYQQTSGQSDSLIGKKLQDLITELPMVTLNKNTEQLYRQNGQDYLFSAAPILVSAKQIGWIIFLRNTTDSLFVIDQLANTTAYASALQSQSHEFMNKLHVIYGLADLEAYQELKIYLNDILTPEKEFSHRLSFLVKNPQIAGFWIGERQKFAERKTGLTIEISPEIPATANKSETKAVIDLYRYIHHILLRMTLSSECRIEIFYAENKLETNYLLELAQVEQKQLQESLASNYFVQLLGEHDSQFSIELQGDLTVLQLTTHYEKVGEI